MLASPRCTYQASLPDSGLGSPCAVDSAGIASPRRPTNNETALHRKLDLRIARALRLCDQLDPHVPHVGKALPRVDHAAPARGFSLRRDAPDPAARRFPPRAQQPDSARRAVALDHDPINTR